jgi:tripartite-type tricarboxylate transporter receptor subunit TctC
MKSLLFGGALMTTIVAATVLTGAGEIYPNKPVRVITPSPPGTVGDMTARIVTEKMSKILGEPFIVINRAGALGQIGTKDLVDSAPDGYRIGYIFDGAVTTMPAAYAAEGKPFPYNPEVDVVPIGLSVDIGFVLVVRKDLPVHTMDELVTYAKANPGKLNFASGNPTGTLAIALLNKIPGVNIVELRNWKGGEPDGHIQMLGGFVDGMFSTFTTALPHIKTGTERALGTLGEEPSIFLDNTETLSSQGYRTFGRLTAWLGFFGPRGLPKEIVDTLHKTLDEALQDQQVMAALTQAVASPHRSSPEELGKVVADTNKFLLGFIKDNGIKLVGD